MVTAANLRESAELDAILPAWNRLADHSLAPAGLNAPELVLPLMRGLPGAELAVVKQGNDLLFALPGQEMALPSEAHFPNWITALTIIGEPHLDREFPEVALTSFINHLKHPIVLHSLEVNGPFWNRPRQSKTPTVSILADLAACGALHLAGTDESWAELNSRCQAPQGIPPSYQPAFGTWASFEYLEPCSWQGQPTMGGRIACP